MSKRKIDHPDIKQWARKDRLLYRIMNPLRFPEMPENPKRNKNYEYWPEGAVTAEGLPTYGCLRLGTENKLIISFCGGGVSFDEFTAARPNKLGTKEKQVFYAVEAEAADLVLRIGTNGRSKKNPFRDWSILLLPYTTGDFHCGQKDFPYMDLNGKPAILHHRGYDNYRKLLSKIREFVPNPEKLIITGFSAGAFGTALLADDVCGEFPDCRDVTVICDSAMMHHDWQRIAREVWGAPEEICRRLTGTEIVTDSLLALHEKRPDVKIMFCCSTRDNALTQYVGFLEENGNWTPAKETGDRFQKHLADMADTLIRHIPDVGLFYFFLPDKNFTEAGLSTHCICASGAAFTVKEDGVSVAEWMQRGVNGEMLKLGLRHLKESSCTDTKE